MEDKLNEKLLNDLYKVNAEEVDFEQEKYEENLKTLQDNNYNFETGDGE